MGSYTISLKEYVESFSHYNQTKFPLSHSEKIEIGRKELFDFDYPIFDENYRKVFETHFIRNFYMREIGFETMGLFKFQLETWLIINMPYFNKLFESELIEFDPLSNSKVDVTHNKKNDKNQTDNRDITNSSTSNSSGSSTSEGSSSTDVNRKSDGTKSSNANGSLTDDNFERELESNNPDSRLSISANDGEGVIEYASGIKENNINNSRQTTQSQDQTDSVTATDNSKSNDTSTVNGSSNTETSGLQNDKLISDIKETEDFIQHRVGKIGVQSYSKMLEEFRQSFLRIEKDIFKEMQQLFLLIY